MISPESLTERAREIARDFLGRERALREERDRRSEEWREGEPERRRREVEFNQERRPVLERQARTIHEARFQPLEEILDSFKPLLQRVRAEYFSGSPILVVDHYEGHYTDPRELTYRDQQNRYYRALILMERIPESKNSRKVFGIVAVATEPGGKKFIKFGPPRDTEFELGIFSTFLLSEEQDKHWWKFLKGQSESGVPDFTNNVTPNNDLFEVTHDSDWGKGWFYFVSHQGTAPSLSELVSLNPISFNVRDERTSVAINKRLEEVLTTMEIVRQRGSASVK